MKYKHIANVLGNTPDSWIVIKTLIVFKDNEFKNLSYGVHVIICPFGNDTGFLRTYHIFVCHFTAAS